MYVLATFTIKIEINLVKMCLYCMLITKIALKSDLSSVKIIVPFTNCGQIISLSTQVTVIVPQLSSPLSISILLPSNKR